MRTLFLLTAVSLLFLCGAGPAGAGMFNTSVPFDVSITNDPAGNNTLTTSVPLNGGPTPIDNGLMNITETITPTSATSAIIQFTLTTTNNAPLAGNPSGLWQTLISGFQTNDPTALQGPFYYTFVDANGTSDPILFPGYSLAPNPTDPLQTVAEIQASNTSRIVHSLQITSNAFNQPPTNYENGGIVPTTFVMGGQFVETPVPEPASLTLMGIGIVGLAGFAWKRRQKRLP